MKDTTIKNLTLKNVLIVIAYTVLLIWAILNLPLIGAIFLKILTILKPFFYGCMMAYLFNLPLKYFQKHLSTKLGKMHKTCAVLCSLLVVGLVIGFLVMIVFPVLFDSISSFIKAFPQYIANFEKITRDILENNGNITPYLDNLEGYAANIEQTIIKFAGSIVPQAFSIASNIISSVANAFFSIVIAVYLTISKERLIQQSNRFIYAFLPLKWYEKVHQVATLTNKTFSAFFSGQLVEAIIIGILCYLGCLLFNFPYAPIMGVIIGVTNVIPIFGAIFGTVVCGALIAFVSPIQGLMFLVFGTCLQQLESNVIYPRIVGTSVGLSGLWVLFAISIGGGLFGFVGMLFGLPVFSIIYMLIKETMNKRIALAQSIGLQVEKNVVK